VLAGVMRGCGRQDTGAYVNGGPVLRLLLLLLLLLLQPPQARAPIPCWLVARAAAGDKILALD
jgi:hypothetical protein